MIEKSEKIDAFALKLLNALQKDSAQSQRELADKVGLSQNACWRRLQRLQSIGIIQGSRTELDLSALGLDLTVFVMIRTRSHSREWSEAFKTHVMKLPEVTDFYRIGGDWDYLIKVIARGMSGYDAFYQKLISSFDLAAVTGFFSMEAIVKNRPLDLNRLK